MIGRREFIAGLGGAAAWPLAARAQQAIVPVIGFLFAGSREANIYDQAFRKGLSEMGLVEPRNITIDYRYAGDQYDRLPRLAAELANRQVNVIFAGGGSLAAAAAKSATKTIPIVFHNGADPVETGLVESFNRPELNLTGISFMNAALTAKRIGLLHDLVPSASRFAFLINPSANKNVVSSQTANAKAAIAAIGRQLEIFNASTNDEIDSGFASMLQWRAEALVIGGEALFAGRGARQLATLAVRHALPAIHFEREYIGAGGLMSYGSSLADTYRLSGNYVGRVLKGEKPADLPVMQPTRFELVIILTTARAIGVEVPPTLLAIADEVIQ